MIQARQSTHPSPARSAASRAAIEPPPRARGALPVRATRDGRQPPPPGHCCARAGSVVSPGWEGRAERVAARSGCAGGRLLPRAGLVAVAARSRQRGAVAVEYLVVLILVGMALAMAMTQLAPRLLEEYGRRREALYAPGP